LPFYKFEADRPLDDMQSLNVMGGLNHWYFIECDLRPWPEQPLEGPGGAKCE